MEKRAGYFRVAGSGPGSSEPVERIASTAIEAENQLHAISRLCGRSGNVAIYGRDGRTITVERLSAMARAEEMNAP